MAGARKAGLVRWLLWSVAGLLVLAIAVLTFRVPLLDTAGRAGLALAGFRDVTLEIEDVSSGQASIRELSFGDEIILRGVTLRYAPLELLQGRIVAVDIRELDLDLSAPDEGALARLRALASGEGEQEAATGTASSLPAIYLETGRIKAATAARVVEADIAGALTPERKLQAEATINGRLITGEGDILLRNVGVTVDGDLETLNGAVTVGSGELLHDSETPEWQPFHLEGGGELKEGNFDGRLALTTPEGRDLLLIDAGYEMAAATGRAALSITDLAFRKDGFQPAALSRRAEGLPPFDGILNVRAAAELTLGRILYHADAALTELSMTLPEGMVTTPALPLRLDGDYDIEANRQAATVTLPASDLDLAYQDLRYAIEALSGSATIRDFGAAVEIERLNGTLTDRGKTPDFAPLLFSATGNLDAARQLELTGRVTDASEKLAIDAAAHVSITDGQGELSLSLPATKIGKGGVRPADISRHLAIPGAEMSGTVEARLDAGRFADGSIHITSIFAELRDGAWRQAESSASGVTLKLEGSEEGTETGLQGTLGGLVQSANVGGQTLSVPSLAATFALSREGEGQLQLSDLHISPGAGAIFREAQHVTGSATLAGEEVRFQADISSAILGPSYMSVRGRHALATGKGSADVTAVPLLFAKEGVQLESLVELPFAVTLEGKIAPKSRVEWSAKDLRASADIALENLTVELPGGEVSGLEGNLHIDDLFPLTISAPQELRAREAAAGIPITSPYLRFRILSDAGDPVLYIDRMTVGLVGGTLLVEGAKIDTGADINRVDVLVSQLDLEEVMELTSVDELVATGHVSGRIPLIFGGERLLVENGELSADGPGVLKMTSDAARSALGVGGDQAQLVLDILENFQYSELSIAILKTESGADTVKLHAAGSNPDVENNRPIVLNINLETSLDKIFNAVLNGYLLSEKALRATVGNR